ncbi:MAG: Hpt domain-containing protein [Azonexus sp.]|nr:Hpt domain-containing protein [Azonexus sp.]
MQIPAVLDGFDVPSAVARMLDDPVLWWQAVGLFVEHFSEWEGRWQAAIGEAASERRQVHALRSAAANIGADRLAASAAALETVLLQTQAGESVLVPQALRQRLAEDFRSAWRAAAEAWQKTPLSPEARP